MDRVALHRAGHGHVMSFMSFQGVRVVDGQNLLVAIGDDDHLGSRIRHFLVQASASAFAPLAPHLSSLIQPLTVALFPMSSNAIAESAQTKQALRQI